jgi:hypothetical protein
MAQPTMKSALVNRLGDPKLSEADRAHLERWLDEADDPVWEQIAADAESYGILPTYDDGPYHYFIGSVLLLRKYVQTKLDKPSLLRKRERERREQKFADWMALATMMDEVLRRYQESQREYMPPDPSGRPGKWKLPLEWLEQEAQRIRHRAHAMLEQEPSNLPLGFGPLRVNVSRQTGGKRKRRHSRELGTFMQAMVNRMYSACGKPRYEAVAMIANIAFPCAYVDADDVRSACRPTTRAGRRRGSGAPSL